MPTRQYEISERLAVKRGGKNRTAKVFGAELREVDRTGRRDWCYVLEDTQDRQTSSVRQRDLLLDN